MESEVTIVLRDVPYHIIGDCVGVEKGAYVLVSDKQNVLCAIGDFDSVSTHEYQSIISNVNQIIKVSSIKDETDSELAVKWCLEQGYTRIHVFGALSNRLDHQHINLQLAYKYPSVTLYDEFNNIHTYTEGIYVIEKSDYTYFSVFTFETATITLNGFSYSLDHYTMDNHELKTVSNQWIKKDAQLIVHQGKVLVYLTK